MKTKVVHLTSVHKATDTRIFLKECRSLAKHGYDVSLIVPQNHETDHPDVTIVPVKKRKSRLMRMLVSPLEILSRALKLKADIYHFHDPELIPVGLLLKAFCKKVVFDAHENVREQILGKEYLPVWSRTLISSMYASLEDFSAQFFDGVISVVPSIAALFPTERSYIVPNYPLMEEVNRFSGSSGSQRTRNIVYIGAISKKRGAIQLIDAMNIIGPKLGVRLELAGNFDTPDLQTALSKREGWKYVNYHGFVNRDQAINLLQSSSIGVVTFIPSPNYHDMSINKLFEYMAASLPIIASDIALWREKYESYKCCTFVDPSNPDQIAQAVEYLLRTPGQGKVMGENGRNAVLQHFNWDVAEQVLLNVYEKILDRQPVHCR